METREDYDSAILEFCRDNPSLQVYHVGDISHPGISDLDFIVLDSRPRISERVNHFLQGGSVIIMPSAIFSKINYIEKFNLNLIQGVDIPVEDVRSEYFDLIEILEWLPERILLIESVLQKENIEDRKILLYLKSLDRSITKVEKMTMSYFTRPDIHDARKRSKKYNLKKVCEEYLCAAENCWYIFSSSLREIEGTAQGHVSISDYYNFKNRFDKLSIYLNMLASAGLEISVPLSRRVNIDLGKYNIDDNFRKFAIKRWKILNDVFCWFKKNNMRSGMVKYGWLLSE